MATPVLIGACFDAQASCRGALPAMAAASALVALVRALAVRADARGAVIRQAGGPARD